MRIIITLFCLIAGSVIYAQPKLFTQAIVTTKTTVVASEGSQEISAPITNESGDQIRVVRFGGDGETKTTTWLKNDMVKAFSENEDSRTTLVRDNSKKNYYHNT